MVSARLQRNLHQVDTVVKFDRQIPEQNGTQDHKQRLHETQSHFDWREKDNIIWNLWVLFLFANEWCVTFWQRKVKMSYFLSCFLFYISFVLFWFYVTYLKGCYLLRIYEWTILTKSWL